jgi:hypothetical protein
VQGLHLAQQPEDGNGDGDGECDGDADLTGVRADDRLTVHGVRNL